MQRSCWRFAVLPLLAILAVGGCNRAAGTPSSFIDWRDPELDNRISAYVPLVREVNRGSRSSTAPIDPAQARELAVPWVEAVDKGELKQLHPLYLDETPQDEPTYQISTCQRRLVAALTWNTEEKFKQNNFKEGIENIELAFKIYKPTLRTDLITFTNQSLDVRKLLNLLVKNRPQFSPEDLELARKTVSLVQPTGAEVAEFAKTMRRLAVEFQLRYDQPLPQEVPSEDIKKLEAMTQENAMATMVEVRNQVKESLDQKAMQPLADLLIKQLSTEIANQRRIDVFLSGEESETNPPTP